MDEFNESNIAEANKVSVTPSQIIEYLYCPRYIYFMYVLTIPQHEELYFKAMKGREIHKKKSITNTDYFRKKLNVIDKKIEVYLTGNNLRGIVDEVLFLADGTAAPLDYKFAVFNERIFKTYETQAHCYAKLIMENYEREVNNAYLVFIRSKNKLITVPITRTKLNRIEEHIAEIISIITENKFPKATKSKSKCLTCTYRNICSR